MKKNDTKKQFLKYLLPGLLTMMLMAVYTFTDTFVVGRKLGAVALGAMGICTPVLTITYAFGFLFGMGGASLYAMYMGQEKKSLARKVFTTSVITAVVCGIIAAILLNIYARQFAYFLGANDGNINYALSYLRVLLFYIPGFMMDIIMMSFMKNEGHPHIAMIATVTGTLLNVVLDILFVFGFNWGMFGAAFATAFCSGIGCCINIAAAFIKKTNLKLTLMLPDKKILSKILMAGFSILILEASSGIVTFVFIKHANSIYGTLGSGVYTIIMNWSLIFVNLTMGIAQAMQPLVSYSYGSGDEKAIKDYKNYALFSAMIFGFVYILIGSTMTDTLVSVFAKDNKELVLLAKDSFLLYLPAFLFMVPGIIIGYFFQAIGFAKQSTIVMLLRGVLLPVIFSTVMTHLGGGTGLWVSVPTAEFITSVLSFIFLINARSKINEKTAVNFKITAKNSFT